MYLIQRATTGRVGNETYNKRVVTLNNHDTNEAAIAEMKSRRIAFAKEHGVEAEGTDEDYTITLHNDNFNCVDRYWVEEAAK